MARTGKIARLPLTVRTELNQRLRDGALGPALLPWLNSLPEVRAILESDFGNKDINAQNLSDWRQGGYEDWLRANDRLHNTRLLAEKAATLAREAGGSLSEGAAAILSGRILEVLENLDSESTPESLAGIIKSVSLLRSGDQATLKIAQAREELALAQARFQRDTCELFIRWAADQRAAEVAGSNVSHTEKIEALGQLMFGAEWKPNVLPSVPAAGSHDHSRS